MSKMIQIRDVPDPLHMTLKARAAGVGMNLSDYLKGELKRIADRPTLTGWFEEVQQIKPVRVKQSSAEIIRELRNER